MPKGEKRAGGRPPLYKPEYVSVVREMSAHGWTDFSIARAFQVDEVTIWRWRKKYPEFGAASVATEAERLEAVKHALFARATGYSHDSEKIMTRSLGEGLGSEVVREAYVEHYPPDVAAMKFYLTNKSAGEFAERQEVEQSGGVTVRVVGGLPGDAGEDDKLPQVERKTEEP